MNVSFLCWFQLKIRQGTELLIHSENDNVINDWYRALQETISTHVRNHTCPNHSGCSLSVSVR